MIFLFVICIFDKGKPTETRLLATCMLDDFDPDQFRDSNKKWRPIFIKVCKDLLCAVSMGNENLYHTSSFFLILGFSGCMSLQKTARKNSGKREIYTNHKV